MSEPKVEKQKLSKEALRQLRDRPCKTRNELQNWLKYFLQIDFPDSILDPDSNCSALEMIWLVYKNMVWWNQLPYEERNTKFLFYATRGGFKTLGAAVLEVLALIHDKRGCSHVAAGENHVKHCYNDYFQPLTKYPLIAEKFGSSTIEKTTLKDEPSAFVEIMPCTKKRVQGPHSPFLVKDEIDVVEDLSAYEDLDGIPVNTRDGKPPISMGISVRKSAFGLVQREIDNAPKLGVKVYHWNLIDITQACPDSRSGTKDVNYYVKMNTLEAITEDRFSLIPYQQKEQWEKHKGKEHCLTNCKIFAACKGLLKKQKSTSKWLKSVDYTQEKLTQSSDEQMIIAQFLCRKPPSTGLIFPSYSSAKHEKTDAQMYEILTGEQASEDMSKFDMLDAFKKHSVTCYFGIDFGFDPDPNVVLVIFVDAKKNVYVFDEYSSLREGEADLALWLYGNWKDLYKPELVFPDTARPSGRKELEKMGFVCAGPKRMSTKTQIKGQTQNVIKDVIPGISTLRRLIKTPGTDQTKIFVSPRCKLLCFELPRYHNITDPSGRVLLDKPDPNQSDHAVDALRYAVHSLLYSDDPNLFLDANYTPVVAGAAMSKAPTPVEVGTILGFHVTDNTYLVDKDKDEGGGFSFSF